MELQLIWQEQQRIKIIIIVSKIHYSGSMYRASSFDRDKTLTNQNHCKRKYKSFRPIHYILDTFQLYYHQIQSINKSMAPIHPLDKMLTPLVELKILDFPQSYTYAHLHSNSLFLSIHNE